MSLANRGNDFCYVGGWEGHLGKKICIFRRLLLCERMGRVFGKENLCFPQDCYRETRYSFSCCGWFEQYCITICLQFDQYLLRIISVFDDWVLSIRSEFEQFTNCTCSLFNQNLTSIWPTRFQYLIKIWPVFDQRGYSIWPEFDLYLTNEDTVFDQCLTFSLDTLVLNLPKTQHWLQENVC